METEYVASELPHIPFSMRQLRENPKLVLLSRNNWFSEDDITMLSIVIFSFYLAHDHPGAVPGTVISNLVRDCAIGDILLGGDANAHQVIWGSSDINVRGELLYDDVWK